MERLRHHLSPRSILNSVLDVAYPPVCLSCGAETISHGLLCATCFSETSPIVPPFCRRCAAPLASHDELNASGHCAICDESPPLWIAARAAYKFENITKTLIFRLKYGDKTELAQFLARGLIRHGGDVLATADIIAPVPLHCRRLLRRKFNQAALLAHQLRRLSETKPLFVADLIQRRIHTSALARLDPHARYRQVANAFVINPKHCDKLVGRRVVLVDDILTTGATLAICTQNLLEAGAAEVAIMVAARSEKHVLPFAGRESEKRYAED